MNEFIGNIDDLGGVRDDVNKVTEEDVQRIQENSKKAKQIAQQIKKDKAVNDHLAQFLIFLLGIIKTEEIIIAIHRTFFKVTNPKDHISYLRKNINTQVLVGFFAPFFIAEIQKYQLWGLFGDLGLENANLSISNYINYLKKLSETFHDNIPIDQKPLIELIVLIVQEFFKQGKLTNIREEVTLALYGGSNNKLS